MKTATGRRVGATASQGKTARDRETASAPGEKRRLRAALGQYTTGVAVVTAMSDDHRPVGMTINSFASVSLSPPLVSWCLDRGASSHDVFVQARQFAVTVLSEEQSELAMRFATRGADKFRGLAVPRNGPPVLPGGCAWFVCEICSSIPLGDHRMLIGRVVDYGGRPARPLVFSGGQFSNLCRDSARAAA